MSYMGIIFPSYLMESHVCESMTVIVSFIDEELLYNTTACCSTNVTLMFKQ